MVFLKDLLGPLLFLIFINDLPRVCRSFEFFFFADDINIAALRQADFSTKKDLRQLKYWLNDNKLIINMNKTVQMIVMSSSLVIFYLKNCHLKLNSFVRFWGFDSKLSFVSHIDQIKTRLFQN